MTQCNSAQLSSFELGLAWLLTPFVLIFVLKFRNLPSVQILMIFKSNIGALSWNLFRLFNLILPKYRTYMQDLDNRLIS